MKKLKYNSRFALMVTICISTIVIAACKKSIEFKDVILITGTQESKVAKFVVEGVPSSYAVTATATEKVQSDVDVTFQVDTSLVASYGVEMSAKY
ncbi:MAG: hypothetical protein MUP99_04190, partial [Pedobacter sp.]|nr:hypothetical protein [Pedobacter sp.]